MAIAQIGPVTSAVEALAAVVGVGIVLGGFAMGVLRVMSKRPRAEVEGQILTAGYVGGLVGFGSVLLDLLLRYG